MRFFSTVSGYAAHRRLLDSRSAPERRSRHLSRRAWSLRPGRGDQVIVTLRCAEACLDLARRDTDHLVEEHCGVLLMPQDDPDRLGDIGRRQCGGRDLVQKRLEQVIIVAVDHGDIDG
jgi:hypothetical protein